MSGAELVWITTKDGVLVWVKRPPPACPNGHSLRPDDHATTYGEGWFACWCDGAHSGGNDLPGHSTFACKRCGVVTLLPECTDPSMKVGWAASHGQGQQYF